MVGRSGWGLSVVVASGVEKEYQNSCDPEAQVTGTKGMSEVEESGRPGRVCRGRS